MKNIKNKIYVSAVLVCLLTTFSCNEDFLETAPYAQATDETFYQNREECFGALMQTYNRTVHSGPIYLFIRQSLAEYAGDDLLRTQVDDFTPWHNFSPDNVQFLWGWKYCYQGIYLCNYNIEKIAESPIAQKDKDLFIAEAKALRGFMYYLMANRWGKLPLHTDLLSVQEYSQLPYSTAEEVYAQVIKDFQEAIPFLPKSWGAEDKGRFSQAAAKQMLAKTYMMLAGYPINKTDNWQKAVDILAEFVPPAKRADYDLQLLPDFENVFNKDYSQSTESVLEINWMYLPEGANINHEVGGPGSFYSYFCAQPTIYDGGGRECFTKDFLDEFERDSDGNILDKRYTYTVLEPGDVWYVTKEGDTTLHNSQGRLLIENIKVDNATNTLSYDIKNENEKQYDGWSWVGEDGGFYPNYKYMRNSFERTGWQNGAGLFGNDLNLKYLRLSDAILCYAEALNEVGKSAEAVPYINELRTRANNSSIKDPKRIYQKTLVTGTLPMIDAGLGQAELRKKIQHEWRMEIAGEGWRYENIRRWGIAEERLHTMAAKSPLKGNGENDASKYQKGTMDYFPVSSAEYNVEDANN